MGDLINALLNAKAQPSKHCSNGSEHEFQAVMHTDGPESYTWYFECAKCGDVVKKTEKRAGRDKDDWSE